MQKDNFFLHEQGLSPNVLPEKCVNGNKSEFTTKQCKIYLKTSMHIQGYTTREK